MKEGDRIAIRAGDLSDEDIAAICNPPRMSRHSLMQAMVYGYLTIDAGIRSGLTKDDIADLRNWVIDEHGIAVRAGKEEPLTDGELDAIKALGRSLQED